MYSVYIKQTAAWSFVLALLVSSSESVLWRNAFKVGGFGNDAVCIWTA